MTISLKTKTVNKSIFHMCVKKTIYGRNEYKISYELGSVITDTMKPFCMSLLSEKDVGNLFSSSFFLTIYMAPISKVITEIKEHGYFSQQQ